MAVKHTYDDSTARVRALVTVRIPRNSTNSLEDAATDRLQRSGLDVTVAGLRGLEPGLSATQTTVEVTVTSSADESASERSLVETLATAPGVESIDVIDAE